MKYFSIKITSVDKDGDIVSVAYKIKKETIPAAIANSKRVANDLFNVGGKRQIEVFEYEKDHIEALNKMTEKI